MEIKKIQTDKLNPAPYNPRKNLQPGDPEYDPEYWALMLRWDLDSPVTFRADGRTVHDFDMRFQLEDEGFLNKNDKSFRWSMLDKGLNMRLFCDDFR